MCIGHFKNLKSGIVGCRAKKCYLFRYEIVFLNFKSGGLKKWGTLVAIPQEFGRFLVVVIVIFIYL